MISAATALTNEKSGEIPAEFEDRRRIEGHHGVPVVERKVNRGAAQIDARGIDQNLRRAPLRAHALKPLRDPGGLRKVIRCYVNLLCELPKLGCCALKFGQVAPHQDHVSPGLRKGTRCPASNAPRASGNHGKLAFKGEGIHAVSCPAMGELPCIAKTTKEPA